MNRYTRCLLLVTLTLGMQPSIHAQAIQLAAAALNDGQGGYMAQWDNLQKKLIIYRNVKISSVPAARMYGLDGTEIAVFPVRDIQDSWYADVWGLTATPQGGLVLAAGVGYTPPNVEPAEVKSFLLNYDGSGKLQKLWEVWPYQFFEVSADSTGNIFGLGLREGNSPYPLIVKYSPSGKIMKEFFSTSLLVDGEATFQTSSSTGSDQMFIAENILYVWLATTKELFRFSLEGGLLTRTSFKRNLDALVKKANGSLAIVHRLSVNESGDTIAQIEVWSSDAPIRKPFVQLTRLDPDGEIEEMTPLASPSATSSFLWTSSNGKNMYLDYDRNTKTSHLAVH